MIINFGRNADERKRNTSILIEHMLRKETKHITKNVNTISREMRRSRNQILLFFGTKRMVNGCILTSTQMEISFHFISLLR